MLVQTYLTTFTIKPILTVHPHRCFCLVRPFLRTVLVRTVFDGRHLPVSFVAFCWAGQLIPFTSLEICPHAHHDPTST